MASLTKDDFMSDDTPSCSVLTKNTNIFTIKNRISDFELNEAKQINSIRKDAFSQDLEIIRKMRIKV